jgi:type III secretory pathway lipoprotein EscJ
MTNLVKKWIRWAKARIGLMSRRARIAAAVLAGVTLLTCLWLIVAAARPEMAPVTAQGLALDEVAAAQRLLVQRNIPCRLEGGRLLVPKRCLQEAQSLLASEGATGHDASATFDQLARENDIWSSQSQNEKRWQAAKMAALGKLIAALPGVQSATVIFDAGSARKLGGPGVPPSAAVKVTMRPGLKMTDRLVAAVADLVAGSTAGMTRQDVRIVDNTGASHRPCEPAVTGEQGERVRAAEAYFSEKIQASLSYVDGVTVSVRGSVEGGAGRCTGAVVSVPRSYLAGVWRGSGNSAAPPGDADIQSVAAAQLPRIQQTVMRAAGIDEPAAVKVDWYWDVQGDPPPVPADGSPSAWTVAGASVLLVLAVAAGIVGLRLWRRRTAAQVAPKAPSGDGTDAARDDSAMPSGFFGFLRDVCGKDLMAALRSEHPQTIALVLTHVESAKASVVLMGFPPDRQVEIARRMGALDRIDPVVARDVERTLSDRLSGARVDVQGGLSGATVVARILQHAGGQTERAVLDGLSEAEPVLADAIRRRLFVFEDIARMPAARLSEALKTLEDEDLAVALRTAGNEVKQNVLAALTPEAAQHLRQEMDRIGPVRLSDVEEAQQRVVEAVRRLEDGRYVPQRKVTRSGVLA